MSFGSPFYIHFVLHFFIYWAFSIFTLFSTFHMAIYLLFLTSYCPSYTFFSGWNSTQYRHLASHTLQSLGIIYLHIPSFAHSSDLPYSALSIPSFTLFSQHLPILAFPMASLTFIYPLFPTFTYFSISTAVITFVYPLFSTFTYISISHTVIYLQKPSLHIHFLNPITITSSAHFGALSSLRRAVHLMIRGRRRRPLRRGPINRPIKTCGIWGGSLPLLPPPPPLLRPSKRTQNLIKIRINKQFFLFLPNKHNQNHKRKKKVYDERFEFADSLDDERQPSVPGSSPVGPGWSH